MESTRSLLEQLLAGEIQEELETEPPVQEHPTLEQQPDSTHQKANENEQINPPKSTSPSHLPQSVPKVKHPISKPSFPGSSQPSKRTSDTKPSEIPQRITGAGVFLWEYTTLSAEEIAEKQSRLGKSDVITKGYSIMMFGQIETKGKFKGSILYTDPGGKIDDKHESGQTIASRELFEESCGTFFLTEDCFDLAKSFRMESYIIFNVRVSGTPINASDFTKNLAKVTDDKRTPEYWLESTCITRVFIDELLQERLYGISSSAKMLINDAYGNQIQIGRRCIIILRSLCNSRNIYNPIKHESLLDRAIVLNKTDILPSAVTADLPWTKDLLTYTSLPPSSWLTSPLGLKKDVPAAHDEAEVKEISELPKEEVHKENLDSETPTKENKEHP